MRRRDVVGGLGALAASVYVPRVARGQPTVDADTSGGNPLLKGQGVCDPQVRIFEGEAFMYSTHDASPDADYFTMRDWRIWRSRDLVKWQMAGVLRPEDTYFGKPSAECWATDAISGNGQYYLYFSMGPDNIGVVVSDYPTGPWRDPLGKALIAKGDVATEARDPGILQEEDGTSYMVFGTFDYFIARLGRDLVSLVEKPRKIEVTNPTGPFGPGRTDDKPFLHRRGDTYYLSWGSYYAVGNSPYGPFTTVGALFEKGLVEPMFLDDAGMRGPHKPPPQYAPADWLNYDRHGSFFEMRGQSYFACNDQSGPGQSPLYRNSVLCYVHYRADGKIMPLKLTAMGVGRHDARRGISAIEFSGIADGKKEGLNSDSPSVLLQRDGRLDFNQVSGLGRTLVLHGSPLSAESSLEILIDGEHVTRAKMSADRTTVGVLPFSKPVSVSVIARKGPLRLSTLGSA